METILYLIGLVVAFVWGYRFREYLAERKMNAIIKQIENVREDIQEAQDNILYLTIEKHEDTFLVYEKNSNKFLTQSNDQQQLADNLRKMFPNKRFAASYQNLREVGYDESI